MLSILKAIGLILFLFVAGGALMFLLLAVMFYLVFGPEAFSGNCHFEISEDEEDQDNA